MKTSPIKRAWRMMGDTVRLVVLLLAAAILIFAAFTLDYNYKKAIVKDAIKESQTK